MVKRFRDVKRQLSHQNICCLTTTQHITSASIIKLLFKSSLDLQTHEDIIYKQENMSKYIISSWTIPNYLSVNKKEDIKCLNILTILTKS